VGAISAKWAKGTGGPSGDECQNLVTHSLRAEGFDASEDGTGRGTPIVPIAFHGSQDPDVSGDTTGFKTDVAADLRTTQVRRLTPRECERLQGFPDDYTQIPWRNKTAENCPDGPRYKALGNSMAVPVMRWILDRVQKVEAC
jgi:DNA (cytosine-5)-methyltransferase 1